MIRSKICFVAEGVVRDAETNSVSVFNILEGVAAVGFPFFMQKLGFFALWEREAADGAETQGIFTAAIGNEQLSTVNLNINFGDKFRHRTIVNINGLVVPHVGDLHFRVQLAGGPVAEYIVNVTALPAVVQVQNPA